MARSNMRFITNLLVSSFLLLLSFAVRGGQSTCTVNVWNDWWQDISITTYNGGDGVCWVAYSTFDIYSGEGPQAPGKYRCMR
jgi:hypothetical protein